MVVLQRFKFVDSSGSGLADECGIPPAAVRNLSGVHAQRRRGEPERSGCSWKTEDSQSQRASAIFRVAGSIGRLKAVWRARQDSNL